MANQAQIDAVEQLLIALLKSQDMSFVSGKVFESAKGALMDSDGPPGTTQKTDAVSYLEHLRRQVQ